ncbi:MAG: class I SAM-dependent methyltransferase [Planctomycetota bacterium]
MGTCMVQPSRHPDRSLFDFDALAREYDRWYETPAGQMYDRVQKEDVRRLLPPAVAGQTLLDVGCGTGHWSAFFAEMGYRVTGVDLAAQMIEVARAATGQCTFLVADACHLPFGKSSFEAVAAMATLEFLPDPAAAVQEMVRCAKRDAHLLIGTLNRLAPLNRRRLAEGREPYASAHLLAPEELHVLLAPFGHVRMVASSLPGCDGRPSLAKRAVRRSAGSRNRLAGPFLIAEVRL